MRALRINVLLRTLHINLVLRKIREMKKSQLIILSIIQIFLIIYVTYGQVGVRPKKLSFTSDTMNSGTSRGRSQESAGVSTSDVRKRRGLIKDSVLGNIFDQDKSTVVGGLIILPPATKKQQAGIQ